jgi:hypothetical protein
MTPYAFRRALNDTLFDGSNEPQKHGVRLLHLLDHLSDWD